MKKKYLLIGTFDLLHTGHINLMYRASQLGEVYVMITSDRLNEANPNKGKMILDEKTRKSLVDSLVFVKDSIVVDPEVGVTIPEQINKWGISGIVYGSDYANDKNRKEMAKMNGVEYIIFDRTDGVSSTSLREILESKNVKQ